VPGVVLIQNRTETEPIDEDPEPHSTNFPLGFFLYLQISGTRFIFQLDGFPVIKPTVSKN